MPCAHETANLTLLSSPPLHFRLPSLLWCYTSTTEFYSNLLETIVDFGEALLLQSLSDCARTLYYWRLCSDCGKLPNLKMISSPSPRELSLSLWILVGPGEFRYIIDNPSFMRPQLGSSSPPVPKLCLLHVSPPLRNGRVLLVCSSGAAV